MAEAVVRALAEGVVVRPGDILLVRVDVENATQDYVDTLKRDLVQELPERVKVLVVAADQLAVVRGSVFRG